MSIYISGTEGDCPGCPGCSDDPCTKPAAPGPTLMCRTSSASLTKCGFDEFTSPSTPPKVYRTTTLAGTLEDQAADSLCVCQTKVTMAYSGTCTFARATCSETDTGNERTTVYPSDCVTGNTPTDFSLCDIPNNGTGFSDSYTSTVHTQTGTGCFYNTPFYNNYTGSATATLSNEYTTSHLWSDMIGNIPAFSGAFSASNPGARASLTTDERTASGRKLQYHFDLPTLTGYTCYKLTWDIVIQPDSGGNVVYASDSYLWNGTDTSTPDYTVGDSGAQLDSYYNSYGSCNIVVGNVVATCACA